MSKAAAKNQRPAGATYRAKKAPTYGISTGAMSRGTSPIKGVESGYPAMPSVYYTPEVKAQMDYIVDKCNKEVGWLALAKHYPKKDAFLIYRVMLPSQEVSSTETDIDGTAMAEIGEELLEEDAPTEDMYVWFHSHVNMQVSPSQQDELQVEEFLESCPIFIRGIVNKKGDSKVDVYFRDYGIAYTCVPTDVYYHFETNPCAGLDDLIKERVKDTPPLTYGFYNGGRQGGYPHRGGYNHGGYLPDYIPRSNKAATDPDDYFDTMHGEAQLALVGSNDSPLPDEELDTGFGTTWDEDDPIALRPTDWDQDPYYWMEGFETDTFNPMSEAYLSKTHSAK